MTQHSDHFWWWVVVAVAANATILVGYLAGDVVSALMVVAGVGPIATALFHLFQARRYSPKAGKAHPPSA